jgi:hypothetical protein
VQQLTVLLHLSPDSAFEGGGTAFWPEGRRPEDAEEREGVVVHPAQGDALFWHGDLTHAARTVARGTRHVLVCSFSLYPAESKTGREPFSCMGIPGGWPRHWSL